MNSATDYSQTQENDNIVIEKNDPKDCIVIQMDPPIFPRRDLRLGPVNMTGNPN